MKSHGSKRTKSTAGAITVAALVFGGGMVGAENVSAMETSGFSFLGSGRQLRSSLIDTRANAADVIYGANHEGEGKSGGEGKCGEGKCGESKKGDGKDGKGDSHKEGKDAGEAKCGEGKCGE